MPTRSVIGMRCIADTGTFARYLPFSDERQVIVRRGAELGHDYGLKDPSEQLVTISGVEVYITRHRQILSPPVSQPSSKPMTPEAARRYQPVSDVLRLPDAEVLIRRNPDGFSDDEVTEILAAITFE